MSEMSGKKTLETGKGLEKMQRREELMKVMQCLCVGKAD